jgi:hypothetical protein
MTWQTPQPLPPQPGPDPMPQPLPDPVPVPNPEPTPEPTIPAPPIILPDEGSPGQPHAPAPLE